MTDTATPPRSVLDPIDRMTEVMFGLFMALTFTGTMSVALGEGATVRDILLAAIGCNIAWGMIDGAVHVLSTVTERARSAAQVQAIRAAEPRRAVALLRAALPEPAAALLTHAEADAIAGWLRRHPAPPPGRGLTRDDLRAAVAVFLLVTSATWPPILPFVLLDDVFLAMRLSNGIAVAMLIWIGWQLDRQMKNGSRVLRVVVPVVGLVMVAITIALGG